MQIKNISYEEEDETMDKAKLKVLKKFWAFTENEEINKIDINMIKENFIGNLQMICQKFKRLGYPYYEDMGKCGKMKFEVICKIGDKTTNGRSITKQAAKQDAARKMIKLIQEKIRTENEETNKNNKNMIKVNYIGKLQITCQKFKRLGVPFYEDVGECGKINRRQFEANCKLGDKTTNGRSRTKQAAKHDAARKMLTLFT